jgi:predicted small integral membrane protein
MTFSWMAWTVPTALFFAGMAGALFLMGLWQHSDPRNPPRVGILGIATQRGDRLFVSLLGSAFIHLAWLGLAPPTLPLWGASGASLVYAALVFRFV